MQNRLFHIPSLLCVSLLGVGDVRESHTQRPCVHCHTTTVYFHMLAWSFENLRAKWTFIAKFAIEDLLQVKRKKRVVV